MSIRDTSIDPRLIESARKEFMEKGFIKAELKTICNNANITTGAVYKRYKGKQELFGAVVEKAVATLDSFVSERTDVDFSSMSDEEVRNTWIMNEKYILDVFKILWDIREDFVLLLEKSAGTIYENFRHDFAFRMTHAYKQYYQEAKREILQELILLMRKCRFSVRYSGHLFMSLSFIKCLGKKSKSIARFYADLWIGKMR